MTKKEFIVRARKRWPLTESIGRALYRNTRNGVVGWYVDYTDARFLSEWLEGCGWLASESETAAYKKARAKRAA